MANEVEHISMCLFTISISSWVKCHSLHVIFFFFHFLLGFFKALHLESSLYVQHNILLLVLWFANIFPYCVHCPFIPFIVSLDVQKFLVLWVLNTFVFH